MLQKVSVCCINLYLHSLKDEFRCTVTVLRTYTFYFLQVEILQSDIEELQTLAGDPEGDKEMQQLAEQDLNEAQAQLESLEEEVGVPWKHCHNMANPGS